MKTNKIFMTVYFLYFFILLSSCKNEPSSNSSVQTKKEHNINYQEKAIESKVEKKIFSKAQLNNLVSDSVYIDEIFFDNSKRYGKSVCLRIDSLPNMLVAYGSYNRNDTLWAFGIVSEIFVRNKLIVMKNILENGLTISNCGYIDGENGNNNTYIVFKKQYDCWPLKKPMNSKSFSNVKIDSIIIKNKVVSVQVYNH